MAINYSGIDKTINIPEVGFGSNSNESILSGHVKLKDLILNRSSNGSWRPKSWTANGALNFQPQGLGINPKVNVSYISADGAKPAQYIINEFEFNANQNSIFKGNTTIRNLQLAKQKNNKWQATSWEGQGQLAINTPGISLNANAEITYQANSIENDNKNTIEIKSAKLKAGASDLLSAGAEVKDLIITQGSNNKWTPQSWTAIGSPNLNSNGIKISGEVDISYNRD